MNARAYHATRHGYHWMAVIALGMALAAPALAGPREQAKRIHERIAGVPPTAAVLNDMESDIAGGNPTAAAYTAMQDPNFYNVTLKNWVTPWTNEAQTVFAPLNDYTATVIGMIRDDIPFNQVLSRDILYVGAGGLGLPAYSVSNNNHYEALENQGVDMSSSSNLVQTTQSSMNPELQSTDTAGVMTTRQAARAFFYAGTNRAMFRFTLMNYMCRDLEQVKDTTRAPDRIRQDVSRSPGGDSRIFMNNCVGCHSGMDPMAQAFAYYEWEYDSASDPEGNNGRLVYNGVGETDPATGTRVQAKYHINENNFPYGYVTPDDQWDNYWRDGPNAILGWDSGLPGSGSGAKSLGEELANSDAFSECQATKVFRAMCLRPPATASDYNQVSNMVTAFEGSNYNMKTLFASAAVYCMGD